MYVFAMNTKELIVNLRRYAHEEFLIEEDYNLLREAIRQLEAYDSIKSAFERVLAPTPTTPKE